MFGRVHVLVAVSSLMVLSGCSWFEKKNEAEATCQKPAQTAPVVRVINVLDEKLYNDAHIKGSVHVDFANVKDAAANWGKDDTIVFYCSNYQCGASFESAKQLKEMGFTNVMAYEGGMEEWNRLSKTDASFAVEGAAQEGYLATPVEKGAADHGDVKVITAVELKQLMQPAA